jgi:hypothetical protein
VLHATLHTHMHAREGQRAAAALDVVAKALKSNAAVEGFRSHTGRDAVHRLTTQSRTRGASRATSMDDDDDAGGASDSDECIMGGEYRQQVSGGKRSTSTKQSSNTMRQAPPPKRVRGVGSSKRAIIDDSDSSDELEIIEDAPAAMETFRYRHNSNTSTSMPRAATCVPDDDDEYEQKEGTDEDPIDLVSPGARSHHDAQHRGTHNTIASVPVGSSTVSRRCQSVTTATNASTRVTPHHVLAARSEDSQVMGLWDDDVLLAHSAVL